MKKTIYFISTICVGSILLSACHTQKKAASATENFSTEILNGEWEIKSVDNKPVTGGEPAVLSLNLNEKKISGNNSCNIINGSIILNESKPNEISFGRMMSTMRFCADAQSETAIMKALNETKSFTVLNQEEKNTQIAFCNAKNKKMMVLQKKDMPILNGEWSVVSLNGAAVTGEHTPIMSIDLNNLKLTGYAGCNRMNGEIVINAGTANSISFTRPATTRMACPDSNIENIFLSTLMEITQYKVLSSGNVALCDKDGNQLIIMSKNK